MSLQADRPTNVTTVPTYEEICRLPQEVPATVIPLAFEDENGHMNIRHYFDLSALAIATVFERMGITDDYRANRQQGFFTAEHHLRYFAETGVGETVSVHFALLERSDKVLHGMSLLVNNSRRQVANSLEFIATHMNMTTRRVTPFESDIAASIDQEFARVAAITWTPPVCGAMGIRRR